MGQTSTSVTVTQILWTGADLHIKAAREEHRLFLIPGSWNVNHFTTESKPSSEDKQTYCDALGVRRT